jgi:bacterioferritin-associated ferredoxin
MIGRRRNVLRDQLGERALPPARDLEARMYVCICYAVTEREVAEHVAAGARDQEALGAACGAGTGCGSCEQRIDLLLGFLRRGELAGVADR